jgi:Cu(I)/Ag(I) efflux system periplasmic protein CusF
MLRLILGAALAVALSAAGGVLAQTKQDSGNMKHGASAGIGAAQGAAMADGEIRKVNKDAGKLTIKHGPIPSMDMPPMTMVYRVKDPAMLEQVKPGDKVKFGVENVGGAFTVTRIDKAQ